MHTASVASQIMTAGTLNSKHVLLELPLKEAQAVAAMPQEPTSSASEALLLVSNGVLLGIDGDLLASGTSQLVAAHQVTQLPSINTTSAANISSPQIGFVSMLVKGPAVAQNGDSVRALFKGAPIHINDTIMTGAGSHVKITLQDGTVFQLGPYSRATLEMFSLNHDSSHLVAEFEASVHNGSFRFIQEAQSDSGLQHTTIYTPSATLNLHSSEVDGWVDEDGSTTLLHTAGFVDVSTLHQSSHLPPEQAGSMLHISAMEPQIQTASETDVIAFQTQLAPLNTVSSTDYSSPQAASTPPVVEMEAPVDAVIAMNHQDTLATPEAAQAEAEAAPPPTEATPPASIVQAPSPTIESTPTSPLNIEPLASPAPETISPADSIASDTPIQTAENNNTSSEIDSQTEAASNPAEVIETEEVSDVISVALLDETEAILIPSNRRSGANLNRDNTSESSNNTFNNDDPTITTDDASKEDEHLNHLLNGELEPTDTALPVEPSQVFNLETNISIAVNQTLEVSMVDLLANTEFSSDELKMEVGNEEHGQVILDDNAIMFVPEENFVGTAGFDYELTTPAYTARLRVIIEVETSSEDTPSEQQLEAETPVIYELDENTDNDTDALEPPLDESSSDKSSLLDVEPLVENEPVNLAHSTSNDDAVDAISTDAPLLSHTALDEINSAESAELPNDSATESTMTDTETLSTSTPNEILALNDILSLQPADALLVSDAEPTVLTTDSSIEDTPGDSTLILDDSDAATENLTTAYAPFPSSDALFTPAPVVPDLA